MEPVMLPRFLLLPADEFHYEQGDRRSEWPRAEREESFELDVERPEVHGWPDFQFKSNCSGEHRDKWTYCRYHWDD